MNNNMLFEQLNRWSKPLQSPSQAAGFFFPFTLHIYLKKKTNHTFCFWPGIKYWTSVFSLYFVRTSWGKKSIREIDSLSRINGFTRIRELLVISVHVLPSSGRNVNRVLQAAFPFGCRNGREMALAGCWQNITLTAIFRNLNYFTDYCIRFSKRRNYHYTFNSFVVGFH